MSSVDFGRYMRSVAPVMRKRGHGLIDRAGVRYGRLLVIGWAGATEPQGHHWLCRCDCGATLIAAGERLRQGKSSCGCLKKDVNEARNKAAAPHGEADKSPEYKTWSSMRERCLNPRHKSFPNYGGRGIAICDRWRLGDGGMHPYECFLADMGRRPSPKHSIDRYPDNDGDYEPGNCRWATASEQQQNKRRRRRK